MVKCYQKSTPSNLSLISSDQEFLYDNDYMPIDMINMI